MHIIGNKIGYCTWYTGCFTLFFSPQLPIQNNTTDVTYDNRPEAEHWGINTKNGDDQFIKTFDLKLVAGRNLFTIRYRQGIFGK